MEVRETWGGLLLAEESAAPRDIRDALKRIDPGLILGQEVDSAWSCFVWKVLLRQGDRPAIWLFDWRDPSGKPLPLSSGIVDEAAALRRDSRRPDPVDPLQANDALVEASDRESEELAHEIASDVNRRRGRVAAVHRSRALYLSRSRARRS